MPMNWIIEDKETARNVSKAFIEASGLLAESVAAVARTASADQLAEYKLAVGKVLGEMLFEIVNPLYGDHPDLIPNGMMDPPPASHRRDPNVDGAYRKRVLNERMAMAAVVRSVLEETEGDWTLAKEICEFLVSVVPNDAEYYLALAKCCRHLKDDLGAKFALERSRSMVASAAL